LLSIRVTWEKLENEVIQQSKLPYQKNKKIKMKEEKANSETQNNKLWHGICSWWMNEKQKTTNVAAKWCNEPKP
jgi:hypothetical protein